jgi:UDP-N-acetylglucosamine acyltransferase
MNIHPTALVSPAAVLADDVAVGPYAVVGPDVHVGTGSTIGPHAVIDSHTDIGPGCRIFPFAAIGAVPQDLKFRGEETRVVIGANNTIREYVTIHRATAADIGVTIMGSGNLVMAYCHIAHNCRLGNNIIMSNATSLAGHVHVEDHAVIGGMTGIHQFTRIGAHCMIGGASAVVKDIPPYVIAAGNHAKLYGLNLIGLKRRGFSAESIAALKEAYRIVFRSSLRLSVALAKVKAEVADLTEVRNFVAFIAASERGICR